MFLCARGITKAIKKQIVLEDIDISAPSGSVTGLAGSNGSGKTMLLRILTGLVLPSSGSVEIEGGTLGRDFEFPPSVGVLIENPAFLGTRTGLDNLMLLASIKNIVGKEELRETLSYVGLNPDDRRPFSKYSLGMKQRLGLASAIMERPRLLLLDEPSNALDPSGLLMLHGLISEMSDAGSAVIVSSHDAQLLNQLSDRVYHLSEGRVERTETIAKGGR